MVYITARISEYIKNIDNMICTLAQEYAEKFGIQEREFSIVREQYKKPYFKNSNIHFSVSHSGKYTLFALSDAEVGIDIQQFKNNNQESIASRFFNYSEYEWLKNNNYDQFFDVWTAKESYVKFTGDGITDAFGAFSVVSEGEIKKDGVWLKKIPFVDGYSVYLCVSEETEFELFCR